MHRKKGKLILAVFLVVLLLSGILIGAAWAQSGSGFTLGHGYWNGMVQYRILLPVITRK